METLLGDHERVRALIRSARVPPSYSAWKRTVGLYPLAALPFGWGVARYHDSVRRTFAAELEALPSVGTFRRYRLEPPPSDGDIALSNLARDAAGIYLPTSEQAQRLFARFAPTWEIDTVTGRNSKGYLITVVERRSKLTLIKRVPDRQSDQMAKAIIKLMRPYKDNVLTITADNGKEFTRHQKISKSLKADVYFAHPFHAWERGLNENTNGLLRQYFPKKLDFRTIDDKNVQYAMDRLNNRPRKTLGYATPNEVFFKETNNM